MYNMFPSHLLFFVLLSLPLALSKIDGSNLANINDLELQDLDKDDGDDPTCYIYKALATELLKDDRNFYKLQNVFFPPNSDSPVFVTVRYTIMMITVQAVTQPFSGHLLFISFFIQWKYPSSPPCSFQIHH